MYKFLRKKWIPSINNDLKASVSGIIKKIIVKFQQVYKERCDNYKNKKKRGKNKRNTQKK